MAGARARVRHDTPMGIASPDARTTAVRCRGPDCETFGPREDFYHGEYCSRSCKFRHDGHKLLAPVKHDHTLCFTCGRILKTVYRPSQPGRGIDSRRKGVNKHEVDFSQYVPKHPPREGFIGWQTSTPAADYGEKDLGPVVGTGIVCECGNTAHRERVTELFERNVTEYVDRLCDRLAEAHDDVRIDRERVIETARERGLAYAVGKHARTE